MTASHIVLLALALFTAAVAYVDIRTGHIPNRLVLLGFGAGVLLHVSGVLLFAEPDASRGAALGRALSNVALGLLVCGLVPLLLFRLGAMGGGDVKLLAAIGAAAGPVLGLEIQLMAFVAVALYAPARLAYEGKLMRMLGNSAALIANPFLPKPRRREVPSELLTSLPFGPAVFAATALASISQWWSA